MLKDEKTIPEAPDELTSYALDWASKNCGCTENADLACVATYLVRGFIAGALHMRQTIVTDMCRIKDERWYDMLSVERYANMLTKSIFDARRDRSSK